MQGAALALAIRYHLAFVVQDLNAGESVSDRVDFVVQCAIHRGCQGNIRNVSCRGGVQMHRAGNACVVEEIEVGQVDALHLLAGLAGFHRRDARVVGAKESSAAAQRVQVYDDNWQMQSTASHFRVMAEISMGSDVLRIALREVVLDAPISVSANAEVPTYLNRTRVSYDYTADFSDEVGDSNTDYRYIAGQIFSLGDGQGLAWRYTVADRKAGLYKANPISYDDIAALPADGKVGDRDVLCATTEFGTLEPFYCPENARQVVCGLPMDDGLTLCVYLDPLNKACADLVNAAGEQVDHVDLGIEGDNGDFSVTALPRTTDRDAVLKVDFRNLFVALRVQDGKFSLHQTLSAEGGSNLQGVDIYMRNAEDAVLNTAGDALLIATPEYTTVGEANADDSSNIYQTGTLLVVYPLDGSAPRYRGRLNTGGERDWGAQLNRNIYDWPARRYMNYELYEKDRVKRL